MDIPSFLLNRDIAGLLITIAGQSIIVSLIGIILIRFTSGKSAPVRSLACAAVILVMGFVATASIGLRLSGISWSQATIPVSGETGTGDSRISFTIDNELPSMPMSPVFLTSPALAEEMDIAPSTPATVSFSRLFSLPASFFINLLGFIWLTGLLFQIFRLGYGVVLVKNFRKTLKKNNRNIPFNDMLRTVAGTFWKNRLPELHSSPLIDSPITIGLFRPIVIIPQKLLPALSENELKSILLHELAHIYNYDQVIGVLKRIVIAIFWWNPVIYIINREHEQAREEVSDNYVLNELSPRIYIQCLMTLAEKVCLISNYPTAAGMAGRRFDLNVRVEQILSKKRSLALCTRSYLKGIAVSICLVLTFGIAGIHAYVKSGDLNASAKKHYETPVDLSSLIMFEEENTGPENIGIETKKIEKASPEIIENDSKKTPGDHIQIPGKVFQESGTASSAVASDSIGAEDKVEKHPHTVAVQPIENNIVPANVLPKNDPAPSAPASDNTGAEDKIEKHTHTAVVQPIENTAIEIEDSGNLLLAEKITDVEKASDPGTMVSREVSYLKSGIFYLKKGRFEDAIDELSKAIDLAPEKAFAYTARGSAYFRLEQLDKATSDFNRAIEINPKFAAAYQNRGSVFYHQGRFDNAIQDYNKAIAIKPDLAASYIDRGNIYQRRNQIDQAISDYSKALELNPDDAETFISRGIAYYSQEQYQKAFVDFNIAIDLNPGSVSAYIYEGYSHQAKSQYRKIVTGSRIKRKVF